MNNKRMDWKKLLSIKRVSEIGECSTGTQPKSQYSDPRSPFEKDCDQLIFSYPFRRLQDKTQVIPFPSFDFVHTRLTHSLEVASVGRSFGKMVAELIIEEKESFFTDNNICKSDIGALIAAACLAHDIGNPAFGHSGESSISYYFQTNYKIFPWFVNAEVRGYDGKDFTVIKHSEFLEEAVTISNDIYLSEQKRQHDLKTFEGNANGFRILTQNCGKGINPTIALLGTFTKYTRESFLIKTDKKDEQRRSLKKYGFFQTERELFKLVAEELGLIRLTGIDPLDIAYHRHPLAFLMEASDDISYGIIDFEDGCKLGLIDFEKRYSSVKLKDKKNSTILKDRKIEASPKEILVSIASNDRAFDITKLDSLADFKEQISYLRSKVINVLIHECFSVFKTNYEKIMTGEYDKSIIEDINPAIIEKLDQMQSLVRCFVYNCPGVLQVEASGFEVMYDLIEKLGISSGICYDCGDEETPKQKKLSSLLPVEYLLKESTDTPFGTELHYKRIMLILDYISGMTDNYAVSLFRKINGIEVPGR